MKYLVHFGLSLYCNLYEFICQCLLPSSGMPLYLPWHICNNVILQFWLFHYMKVIWDANSNVSSVNDLVLNHFCFSQTSTRNNVAYVSVWSSLVKLLPPPVFWKWVHFHSNLQCVCNYTERFCGWLNVQMWRPGSFFSLSSLGYQFEYTKQAFVFFKQMMCGVISTGKSTFKKLKVK